MSNVIFASCPLCSAEASYYEIDYGERHYYKCPSCNKFSVTRRAEEALQGSNHPELAAKALATNKNDSGSEQVIDIKVEGSAIVTAVIAKQSIRSI